MGGVKRNKINQIRNICGFKTKQIKLEDGWSGEETNELYYRYEQNQEETNYNNKKRKKA